MRPDVALSLPCWLSQFRKAKLRQPTGQRLSNVRTQQKNFQSGQSYSYIMRKVWYISSNLNSKLFRFHCVRPNLDINKKFNLFSPFLHPLSQLSTWGFPWSMNYRKGSNEHSLARSLKYQPCKNQNLGGNFLAVKSCASSSVGWGLEREHNGLKSFIFLSWKTEVNKVLNAPSEMISLNWKMHGVAVNTPCLYMNLDGSKTGHFLFTLPGDLNS